GCHPLFSHFFCSFRDRPHCPAPWGGAVAMAFAERRLGNAPVGTSLCSMRWRNLEGVHSL
ncbi:Uncharacterized protein APZ42_008069, partial [Daphnia magna]